MKFYKVTAYNFYDILTQEKIPLNAPERYIQRKSSDHGIGRWYYVDKLGKVFDFFSDSPKLVEISELEFNEMK